QGGDEPCTGLVGLLDRGDHPPVLARGDGGQAWQAQERVDVGEIGERLSGEGGHPRHGTGGSGAGQGMITLLPREWPASTAASASAAHTKGWVCVTCGSTRRSRTRAVIAASVCGAASRPAPPSTTAVSASAAETLPDGSATRGASSRSAAPPTRSASSATPSGATSRTRPRTPGPDGTKAAPAASTSSRLDSEATPIAVSRSEEHRLNSSHVSISYAVFCLKKKKHRSQSPRALQERLDVSTQ